MTTTKSNNAVALLGVVAAILLLVGIGVGFLTVHPSSDASGLSCGSAFKADTHDTNVDELTGTLVGGFSTEPNMQAECDTARSHRQLLVYGIMGLGVVVGVMAITVSALRRD
jgi:hypothetical protein